MTEVELLIQLVLLLFFVVVVASVVNSAAFVVAPLVCSIVLFLFPITWVHPSSGFGWSPGFGAGLVVRLMVFSWLLLLLLLMKLLLVRLLFNPVVCRTIRVASCLPRPPSSAGPDILISGELPEYPPY